LLALVGEETFTMQIASSAAIIDIVPLAPVVPVARESEPAARQRTKNWIAPQPIGRGHLIALVV
jgi:hypothetical protein